MGLDFSLDGADLMATTNASGCSGSKWSTKRIVSAGTWT
jgi:hypothetical protein